MGVRQGLHFRVLGFRVYGGYIRVISGLYRENGKENGNYYLGFRDCGLGCRV